MIEIRRYEGDAESLARFTTEIWKRTYAGVAPVLGWTPEYFEWELLASSDQSFLLAAYDGAKLVGTLFAEPFPFHLHAREVQATMGSWLTVDLDYRGQAVGAKLVEAQRRLHRERGALFCLGFGVVGTHGPKFWRKEPDTRVLGRIGLWARMFDHRAVAEWASSFRDRALTKLIGPLRAGVPPEGDTTGIRAYREEDLDACLALTETLRPRFQLGYRWTRERLARQLSFRGHPETLVFEREGAIRGFVNWHPLELIDRTTIVAAVIDLLVVDGLDEPERRRLLDAAARRMHAGGAHLSSILGTRCFPQRSLWNARYVPLPNDFELLATLCDPPSALDGVKDLHVQWR